MKSRGKPELWNWVLLVFTAVIFGSSFFLNKIAVGGFPPLTVALLRSLLALPISWSVLRIGGGRLPPPGRQWAILFWLGLTGVALPFTALAWGQMYIESGLAAIIFAGIPVFTVLLAPLLIPDEPFTRARALGVALGMGGVVLVIGPSALHGASDHLFGELITMIPPICYAFNGILVRRHRNTSPVLLNTGQFFCGTIFLLPLSLLVDRPWRLSPSVEAVEAMAAIGALGTAVPTLLIFWLIGRMGATTSSLAAFFTPVFAVFLGAVLLSEWLPWQAYGGLGLVLGGAFFVGRSPLHRPGR